MKQYIENALSAIAVEDFESADLELRMAHDTGENEDAIALLWRYLAGYDRTQETLDRVVEMAGAK